MSVNWATEELGTRLVDYSSEAKGCEARNVIIPDFSSHWLSDERSGGPHWICLNIRGINNGDEIMIRTVGWHCSHSWTTNPEEVRVTSIISSSVCFYL